MTITSKDNEKLKQLRKLHDRKHRDASGLFLAEGEDMLAAALSHDRQPETLFCNEDARAELEPLLAQLGDSVEVLDVREPVLQSAGSLGSGSRVIGVWRQSWVAIADLSADASSVYLHEVSDPGNVGTIVRSASAFRAGAVVLSDRTADPFGSKAVRASMGAIFDQTLVRAEFEQTSAAMSQLRSLALVPRQGADLRSAVTGDPFLFVLGAERAGLPDRIVSACAEIAHVPLDPGGVESLNVAIAATLCLYEDALHRLTMPDPAAQQ